MDLKKKKKIIMYPMSSLLPSCLSQLDHGTWLALQQYNLLEALILMLTA
jgi:hypothetical protein